MVLPVRLETLRAFAAKEAVPEITVAVRDIVTTARIMPIGENVLNATHKELVVDCPGGEMLVMAALPSGTTDGKCAKTWCALVAIADKDGRPRGLAIGEEEPTAEPDLFAVIKESADTARPVAELPPPR